MELHVVTGTGSGPTELAAFDGALLSAGIANYNLLVLSSVIPPNSTMVRHEGALPVKPGTWGDRLYVVMAEQRLSIPGQEAWAGVGWVMDKAEKKGLLVEHHGTDRQRVEQDIAASLQALTAGRDVDFGPIEMQLSSARCEDVPVCALVAVVFGVEGWPGVRN